MVGGLGLWVNPIARHTSPGILHHTIADQKATAKTPLQNVAVLDGLNGNIHPYRNT